MKLLFDQNLSFKLCSRLADIFPESQQVGGLSLSEAEDLVVWDYAQKNGFTIVTQDADFAEIAALRGAPPKVVWLRCGNQRTAVIEHLLRDNCALILEFGNDAASPCLEIY
jgi:predicted nuclease of predicted toxin-antitoxin system